MSEGKKGQRFLTLLVLVVVGLPFMVQFGPGGSACNALSAHPENAASVNGKPIAVADLNQAYAQQLMMMRARFGAQAQGLDDQVLRQIVKPDQVLEQLVSRELLIQAAARNGIVASDAEVLKVIRERPDFQKNGQFDTARYAELMQRVYGKTPAGFEDELRQDLSIQKLLSLVQSGAVVSDEEVKARFQRESDKAALQFVRFLPAMFARSVKAPTPDELSAYIAAHAPQIQRQYETNKFAYQIPEQNHVRRIVLKVPSGQQNEVKARAFALKKEIEGGKAFADVAKASSQDETTRGNGGDLGFVSREALGSPVAARAVVALQSGQISEPLETPAGVEILQVVEKKPATDKPLSSVKSAIGEQLMRRERAQGLAKAAADEALAKLGAGKKLSDLFSAPAASDAMAFSAESRPQLTDTGSFALASATIPKLGVAPALAEAVRKQSTPGILKQLFPVADGFVLAQVTERAQASDADFATQRLQLYDQALQAKRLEIQDSYIKALKKGASVTTNADALAKLSSAPPSDG